MKEKKYTKYEFGHILLRELAALNNDKLKQLNYIQREIDTCMEVLNHCINWSSDIKEKYALGA